MVPAAAVIIAALACTDLDRLVGLSGDQAPGSQSASARPEERRAVELSRAIPGLAGFYYDTAGNVIVAVKAVGGGAQVTRARLQPLFGVELGRSRRRHPHADIIVRTAQYTFLNLRGWRDGLEAGGVLALPGVLWLDLDEVANQVVVGVEPSADVAAIRALAQQRGVPAAAFDVQQSAPYVPQTTLQDQFRPMQGGIQIQRVVGTSRATCTLGFAALWNSQQVFLTAGHCSPNLIGTDSVAQYQPIAPLTAAESAATSPIGREILRYSEACGSSRCASSDAALYGLVPSQAWQLGRIAHPTSGCMPGPCSPLNLNVGGYWVIDTTRASFVVNDLVSKIGSSTGWSQGLVSRTCVDMSPVHGVTYRCQMFANYGANDGDSGSPILLDIMGGADSTVTLGGIHSGKSGSNSVFSPWSGILQDYGGLVVAAAPQDTTRPAVPSSEGLPDDSSRTLASPFGTGERYYRDIVGVAFDDTTSGLTIRGLLTKYHAVIIGGGASFPYPVYHLQIPDPGGTYTTIDSIAQSLNKEPGVFASYIPQWRSRIRIRYRYPTDGPSARRADWASPTDGTRALIAIRAPLAWGCETGTYGRSVRAAIIDRQFEAHNDLAVQQIRPPVSRIQFSTIPTIDDLEHGNRVAGIFGATGDNGIGIAGVMWNSELTLYELGASGGESINAYRDFGYHLVHISDTLGTRILSMSATFGAPGDTANIRWIIQGLRVFFQRGGILVYAIGDDPNARPTISQLRVTMDTAYTGFDKAVAILRDSLGFADNIITVGATDTTGAFLSRTTFWRGGTDILAPGQQILTLGLSNTTSIASYGTSYSTPYVAGVAAQLLTMDPSLTAGEVKGYILRGARQARPNVQTGQLAVAPPVSGAPETIYQLDAYGSLTLLAAERQHIPLCGDRVWVQNNTVYAERDSARIVEELIHLNGPRTHVNVRHGGRRFEASDDTSTLAFEFQQDHWAPTQNPATTSYGGTFVSMEAWSHDLDTLVTHQQWTASDTTFLEFTANTFNPNTLRKFDTLPVPLARFTGWDCINRDWWGNCVGQSADAGSQERVIEEVAYAPVGHRLFVAVNYHVTRWVAFGDWRGCLGPTDSTPNTCRSVTYQEVSERSNVYAIDLTTGRDTLRWPIPGRVYWLGVFEDGGQLVTGEGVLTTVWTWQPTPDGANYELVYSNNGTVTGCGVHYRSLATGAEVRPAIPTTDGCTFFTRGNGTIAPVAAVKP